MESWKTTNFLYNLKTIPLIQCFLLETEPLTTGQHKHRQFQIFFRKQNNFLHESTQKRRPGLSYLLLKFKMKSRVNSRKTSIRPVTSLLNRKWDFWGHKWTHGNFELLIGFVTVIPYLIPPNAGLRNHPAISLIKIWIGVTY